MGKDRRKKDLGKKQSKAQPSDKADSEPKGQREPRTRAHQREISKNSNTEVKDKTTDILSSTSSTEIKKTDEEEVKKIESINTEELFANLKRETDDIKALTTKKYAKRQIFSNWERYEEPAPPPEYEFEVNIQGVDFESLLQAPEGGHFKFKSEGSWDANVTALSGELFSLDIDLLADGLATIPLYKKLDLPITLFSNEEMEKMDCLARTALKQYDITKTIVKKAIAKNKDINLLDVKESSPAPCVSDHIEDKTVLNFDIDQPDIQNEVDITVNEKESYNKSNISNSHETYTKTEIRQTPPYSSYFNEEHPNSIIPSLNQVPVKSQHDICPSGDIKNERLTVKEIKKDMLPEKIEQEFQPLTETKKESKPSREKRDQVTPMRDIKEESTQSKREQVIPIRDSSQPNEIKREHVMPNRNCEKQNSQPKEIKKEQITPIRDIKKETTETTTEIPEQVQQEDDANSSKNVQEPPAPLGQRSSRRKGKGQSQPSESHNKTQSSVTQRETHVSDNNAKAQISESRKKNKSMENQKKLQSPEKEIKNQVAENKETENLYSQKKVPMLGNQSKTQQSKPESRSKLQPMDDDLDFLLSLKKPVREPQLSGLQSSQAAKPSIEEDDISGPDSSLKLASPKKQTEDLEDWLDSMLDD